METKKQDFPEKKDKSFFAKVCSCFGSEDKKKNDKIPGPSPMAISKNRQDPDFEAPNIKGVVLRVRDYKGFNGLKKQSNESWDQVRMDYHIMKEWLQSKKSQDKKFESVKIMCSERTGQIETVAKAKQLSLDPSGQNTNSVPGKQGTGKPFEGQVVDGTASQLGKNISGYTIPEYKLGSHLNYDMEATENQLARLKEKHDVKPVEAQQKPKSEVKKYDSFEEL